MSSLKEQLIKLGSTNPELREHIRPVLAGLTSKTAVKHSLDGVRGHSLMPKSVASKIPDLYSQDKVSDPIVHVKYFSPYSGAVWLVTEYDGRDRAFGWADLGMGMGELGYISIQELAGLNRRGLPLVERDLYFSPKPLSEAK